MTTNPLQQYFRVPKLYVKLPSLGQYNNAEDIDLSVTNEVGVLPLTSIDQLLLKTPDALLNGQTLFKIIQSCVPAIKNVKNLTTPDINAVIVGIRIASSGPNFDFTCKCPKCQHDNDLQVNLTEYLDTAEELPPEKTVEIDNGLIVYVSPYRFDQRNMQLINEFEESKSMRMLDNQENLNEIEKIEKLSNLVQSMAERTFNIVSQSVVKIFISQSKEIVTDKNHIAEFMRGISKNQADAIMSAINELNVIGIKNTASLTCESCNNEWEQTIDFDPTSFFV